MLELEDGGHIFLSCSNCRAGLMDIWRTRPNEPETWKVRCNCPFCGDHSFIEEVQGGFHPGGYKDLTNAGGEFDVKDDVVIFKVERANP